METWIIKILASVAFIIDIIGSLILVLGVVLTFFKFCKFTLLRDASLEERQVFFNLRQLLGRYLMLGLELMIAADIMHTILQPSLLDVVQLFVIVLIRTILSYSIDREMQNSKKVEN